MLSERGSATDPKRPTEVLPLEGVRVLEIAGLEAVQYAGRVLAVLGASVTKVEPPEGDRLRRRPPFHRCQNGGERSVPFEFFNAGKQSVVFAPGDEHNSKSRSSELGTSSDIVLADSEHSELLTILTARAPSRQLRLVAGPFGRDDEYPKATSPFTRFHGGTTGSIVPAEKDMSVRASWSGPNVFECIHGIGIAVAVLAEIQRSVGGDVDYSLHSYGVWLDKMIFNRVSVHGTDMTRASNAYPFAGNLKCSDGFVTTFVIEESQWTKLCHMVQKDDWLTDDRFADGRMRIANQGVIDEYLTGWCAQRTVDEVVESCREFDVPCGRIRDMRGVIDHPALAERGTIVHLETSLGTVAIPRLPFGPDFPQHTPADAPALGQHSTQGNTEQVQRKNRRGRGEVQERPLDGIRVLDFTLAGAGGIVTTIMACLGADVAKIEHRSRPDLMRIANKQYGYPGDLDLDSSPSFNEIAAGKRSVELDLRDEEDRKVAFKLARAADVIVENMRPGKMESLGFGYEAIAKVNPSVIMCSVSATGRADCAVPGYAPVFWAEGGGAWLTGWPHRVPGVIRGPVDLHVSSFACLGVLALLRSRTRTGIGGYVDCSAIECVAAAAGVELLAEALGDSLPQRSGNAASGTIVNDLFPCDPDEQWIALTVNTDEELESLCDVLGETVQSLMETERSFGSEAMWGQLAERTRKLDGGQLEKDLTSRGVPAALSLSLNQAVNDDRLLRRGTFQLVSHPTIGQQMLVGLPWRFNTSIYTIEKPAPMLGQDTQEILSGWIGLRCPA